MRRAVGRRRAFGGRRAGKNGRRSAPLERAHGAPIRSRFRSTIVKEEAIAYPLLFRHFDRLVGGRHRLFASRAIDEKVGGAAE